MFDFTNPLANVPLEYTNALGIELPGFWEQYSAQSTAPTTDEPWYITASRVASTLIMADHQRQLLNVQLERAKKGLPPLETSQYSGVGVNVGLSADTRKLLIFGGLALAGILIYGMSRR